jgi:methyl-accepting chemotaxis protein
MKIYQSIKIQFVILLSALILAVSLSISFLGIARMEKVAIETFTAQGVYVAEKAASIINGDSFEALTKSLNEDDPFYEETRLQLFNLKQYSSCVYLYTMAPVDGNTWHFIIDGSVEPGDEDFSPLGETEDVTDYDIAFKNVLKTGKTEISRLVFQEGWGWLVSIYTPVKNSSGKMVGIVGCDFDGASLHEAIVADRIMYAILSGISIILGLGFLIVFQRKIFTRLSRITDILKEIAMGEGDLTKRITVLQEDEMGILATYFDMTLDKLQNLVASIKAEASQLLEVGNNLASNMHQTAGAINQITSNIQVIEKKVTSQLDTVSSTSRTMNQVTQTIVSLGKNVEDQTSSVEQSSAAIEEMLANIQSVTNTLIRNAENVNEMIRVSDEGRSSLIRVSQDIQEISRESEGLLEINSVMENIASQTSLLSMNAAIEAAHAGETGKGFAVVAGEIRKLAVDSSNQSKTIADVLKKIKVAIDTITNSTNTVLDKFQAIDEKVRTVSDQETNIRNAMEEQGHGSHQILQAIAKLNELTGIVKQDSLVMDTSSKRVIDESNTLETITAEIAGGMHEMASSASQINNAVNQVEEISRTNKDHIDILFAAVSKFKI